MERRDYILRMIEQIGQVLIALRNRILGRAPGSEVERDLHAAAGQSGLDLDLARAATPQTLVMLIAPFGEVEPGRCWLAAEILYLDGLNAALEDRTNDARSSLRKARALFELVGPGGAYLVGLPEARDRIREIDERLAGLGPDGS